MGGEISLKMEFGSPFTIRYRRVGICICRHMYYIYKQMERKDSYRGETEKQSRSTGKIHYWNRDEEGRRYEATLRRIVANSAPY